MINDFSQYYVATEPGRRERAHAWATAIGLQDVDGLKPSKYLIATAKRHIEGEISQEDARRLVDEYYETKLGHDEPEDAKEADKVSTRMIAIIKVLIYGCEIELHNRFLRIGQEYGTPVADAVAGLHRRTGMSSDGANRRDDGINDGINRHDDGINDGINFSMAEEKAIKLILRMPSMTAVGLAGALGLKKRQAERIIASLKKKAGLVREGSRKSGTWRFPTNIQT